jgi:hypothetical protein
MKLTTKQWVRIRQGIYAVTSLGLKVAGLYGLVSDEKGQAILLLVSGVADLALIFAKVPEEETKQLYLETEQIQSE